MDTYAPLYDLLPEEYFITRMDDMIACRDQLIEVEKTAPSPEALPNLIELGIELSENGYPRLEIRREFVEMLIADADMTNAEIGALIGKLTDLSG